MTGWLDGKRALVVGAGSGIGRAVVDAFIAEGAKVAVLERDRDKCHRLGAELPDVPVVRGDATSRADNEHAVTVAVDAHGGLDTLVNCVGVFDFYRGSTTSMPMTSPPRSTRCFARTCSATCSR